MARRDLLKPDVDGSDILAEYYESIRPNGVELHFFEAFRLRGEMILEAGKELERLRRRVAELEGRRPRR